MPRTDADSKFERVYRQYFGMMYNIAFHILQNSADAEDAVQDAFLYLARNPWKIRKVDSFETKSYIAVLTRHRALNLVQERHKHDHTELDDSASAAEITTLEESGLVSALRRLPANYRELIALRYLQGCSVREIAGIVGLKENTVRKTLSRAKKELNRMLAEGGDRR